MRIGVIGLGAMGLPIACNLVKGGHAVVGWNRGSAPRDALKAAGGAIAATPAEACAGSELVISMLADDAAVQAIFLDGGLVDSLPAGSMHVNMATVSTECAQALQAAHAKRKHVYLSAPVLGNSTYAEGAKLHVLVAGDAKAIETLRPVFACIGQSVWPLGDQPQQANVAKIATNFLLGVAVEALSEAMAMVDKHGLDREGYMNVIGNTVFAAPAYKLYGGKIAKEEFEPVAFKLLLAAKDMQLARSTAGAVGLTLPMAEAAYARMAGAVAAGGGDKDLSALGQAGFGTPAAS